jgi:hypothetical protein
MIPTAFITKVCAILGDTNRGLSGSRIVDYLCGYAADFGVDIPYADYPFRNTVPNKRTALKKNLLSFSPEQQAYIIHELCQLDDLKDNEPVRSLRVQLLNRYGHLLQKQITELNTELIEETNHWLDDYPDALKLYNNALEKYESQAYSRNLLDDLRLSLEKLLQAILGNNKSLENQISSLGSYIKERGGSKELCNMFVKLFDYYSKYQNTYVKHDDSVIEDEVEIIFELTCSFMRFMIRQSKC